MVASSPRNPCQSDHRVTSRMKNPQIQRLCSANGATSSLAWGNAPGKRLQKNKALKALPQLDRRGLQTRIESRFRFGGSRSPSAMLIFAASPPLFYHRARRSRSTKDKASIDTAPLALNTYSLSALKTLPKNEATPCSGRQTRALASYIT